MCVFDMGLCTYMLFDCLSKFRARTSREKSVSHVMHGKPQARMDILLLPATGLKNGHPDSGNLNTVFWVLRE